MEVNPRNISQHLYAYAATPGVPTVATPLSGNTSQLLGPPAKGISTLTISLFYCFGCTHVVLIFGKTQFQLLKKKTTTPDGEKKVKIFSKTLLPEWCPFLLLLLHSSFPHLNKVLSLSSAPVFIQFINPHICHLYRGKKSHIKIGFGYWKKNHIIK